MLSHILALPSSSPVAGPVALVGPVALEGESAFPRSKSLGFGATYEAALADDAATADTPDLSEIGAAIEEVSEQITEPLTADGAQADPKATPEEQAEVMITAAGGPETKPRAETASDAAPEVAKKLHSIPESAFQMRAASTALTAPFEAGATPAAMGVPKSALPFVEGARAPEGEVATVPKSPAPVQPQIPSADAGLLSLVPEPKGMVATGASAPVPSRLSEAPESHLQGAGALKQAGVVESTVPLTVPPGGEPTAQLAAQPRSQHAEPLEQSTRSAETAPTPSASQSLSHTTSTQSVAYTTQAFAAAEQAVKGHTILEQGRKPEAELLARTEAAAQLQATGQTSAQTSKPTLPQAPIMTGVREAMEAISLSRQNQIEIQLHPKELGKLRFTMAPMDGQMVVQISAERPEVLDGLKRNIELLSEELRSFGFEDATFEFLQQEQGSSGQGANTADPSLEAEFDAQDTQQAAAEKVQRWQLPTARLDIRV